jgi:hypothetical protein
MARIGDLQIPNPFGGAPLSIPTPAPGTPGTDPVPDPAARANFLALAASSGPNQQALLVDMAAATDAGKRATYIKYGIGAVAGVALGVVGCKLLGR